MSRFLKIGEAAKLLGVSLQTLRRWEQKGILSSERKHLRDTRYYSHEKLLGSKPEKHELTLAYARVSSNDQKDALHSQVKDDEPCDWESIFELVIEKTLEASDNKQLPQYELQLLPGL